MVEEIVKQIKVIEEKAQTIIETAKKDGSLDLIRARKKTETILSEAEKSARLEAKNLIEKSRQEAEKGKQEIEKQNQREVEELRQKTSPKIDEAKKLCR